MRQRCWRADLVDFLTNLTDKPWCEINYGKPLTPNKLAKFLKPFGIKSKQMKWEEKNLRGYDIEDFKKVFNSYIPPSQSATPLPCSNDKAFSDFQSATKEEKVALSNERKLPINQECSTCSTFNKGVKEEEENILIPF